MGKYNEELTKTGVMFAGEGLHPSSKDGAWAGGEGGYALAREFLTVRKPQSVSFRDAAVLPMCILFAFKSLYGTVGVDVPHIVQRHVIQFFKR
jgi:hypothetical protein